MVLVGTLSFRIPGCRDETVCVGGAGKVSLDPLSPCVGSCTDKENKKRLTPMSVMVPVVQE